MLMLPSGSKFHWFQEQLGYNYCWSYPCSQNCFFCGVAKRRDHLVSCFHWSTTTIGTTTSVAKGCTQFYDLFCCNPSRISQLLNEHSLILLVGSRLPGMLQWFWDAATIVNICQLWSIWIIIMCEDWSYVTFLSTVITSNVH